MVSLGFASIGFAGSRKREDGRIAVWVRRQAVGPLSRNKTAPRVGGRFFRFGLWLTRRRVAELGKRVPVKYTRAGQIS